MKVLIRNPQRRELEVEGKMRVKDLLKNLDLNPESHIVIRDGEILTSDQWLEEDDSIQVVSAVSGGA